MKKDPDIITEEHLALYIKIGACEEGVKRARKVKRYSLLPVQYRAWLAMQSHIPTPTTVLNLLSKDKSAEVRSLVTDNSNTSPKTLDRLSNDKNIDVRYNVASNINTWKKTLKRLQEDKNGVVSSRAYYTMQGRYGY